VTSDTRAVDTPVGSQPERGRKRRRLRALLVLLAIGGLLAWGAYAAISLLTVRAEVTAARELAQRGVAALLDADPATAHSDLTGAVEAFSSAQRRLEGPTVLPLRAVPVLRPNVRGATALAAAGARSAAGGQQVAGALADLPGGVGALLPRGGVIPLEPIERIAPALRRADELLAEARGLVATAPETGLVGPLAEARAELVTKLNELAPAVATAARVTDALPAFLGGDGPKRYFLGASNTAELRGSGGLVGAYALLTIDRGAVDIGGFSSIHDLPVVPADDIAPPNPDYAARYNRYGGAGFWQNINMTPDFPSAATAIEALYERVTGTAVDGTIVVHPHALAGLLALTGAAEVPGGGTVDADTVVAYVANEAFGQLTDPDARKELLGAVAAAALERFLTGDTGGSPVAAVRALGGAAGGGHLVMHARDPEVQAAFEDAGVAGRLLDPDGDYLAAVVNNAAANKADFYADRTVHYRVELHEDGAASATAAVELANHAPMEGAPAYVIGPNVADAAPGENRSLLSVYCARGCRREGFRRSLTEGVLREDTELGHPVFTTMVPLRSGEAERVELDWTLDDAWEPQGDGGVYRLTVQNQPTIRPTRLVVEITPLDGMVVTSAPEGFSAERERVVWVGDVSGTWTASLEFAPIRAPSVGDRVRGFLSRDLPVYGSLLSSIRGV
jgi:hypothetical protein